MEKYFRKITENTHFKGFVAGVVTSTIAFGLLSSAIFYMAIQGENEYEYQYEDSGRYYENTDNIDSELPTMKASDTNLTEAQSRTLKTQNQTPATQTENVILYVNEFDKPKIDIDKVNAMLSRDPWGAGYFP